MRLQRLRFPFLLVTVSVCAAAGAQSPPAPGQTPSPPAQALTQNPAAVTISLDDAIQMALRHNHNMLAARTTIQQSEAEETTANLRPNPVILSDCQFLPVFQPSQFSADYLDNTAQFDRCRRISPFTKFCWPNSGSTASTASTTSIPGFRAESSTRDLSI